MKPPYILIVEDDEVSYEYLKLIVKKVTDKYDIVYDGKQAINIVEEKNNNGISYDLIIMDYRMAIMTGYDATKIIKSKYPDLPIIIQTAMALHQDITHLYTSGCDEIVTKPFTPNQMINTIEKLIK